MLTSSKSCSGFLLTGSTFMTFSGSFSQRYTHPYPPQLSSGPIWYLRRTVVPSRILVLPTLCRLYFSMKLRILLLMFLVANGSKDSELYFELAKVSLMVAMMFCEVEPPELIEELIALNRVFYTSLGTSPLINLARSS